MTRKAYRFVSAIALAAVIASAATILPTSFSDQVVASAPIHPGKGDRLDIRPIGSACSEQAWPNYEAKCLRDGRAAMGEAKAARIVGARI